LDRGLARGLIWLDVKLPEGSPRFVETLTEDLLDYAFTLFAMALRVRFARVRSGESYTRFRHVGDDPTLTDDVGLVVLDGGPHAGSNEREVR